MIPYLDSEEGKALSDDDLQTFYRCVRTGIDNEDSGLGCYAMTPEDYTKFGGFFNKVIRDYHGDESGEKKVSWLVLHDFSSGGGGSVSKILMLLFASRTAHSSFPPVIAARYRLGCLRSWRKWYS